MRLPQTCHRAINVVMTDETETDDDLNYFIVRMMINLGALAVVAGLVAMLVFCARTID